MNGRVAKEHRRTALAGAKMALASARPVLDAALNNEALTRARVDRIEALLDGGFWARLRWLFLGEFDRGKKMESMESAEQGAVAAPSGASR